MRPILKEDIILNSSDESTGAFADLFAISIVAVVYFAYMLSSVDLREIFEQPVAAGILAPWGLVGGIAVVGLVMIMAGLYMALRNASADSSP